MFVLNIIHRPEMVPEYSEKTTGQGKLENISRKELLNESLDIFKLQQQIAHENGLKTTIQMTYASLFNEEAISLAKEHHEKYGDEIALTLLGLPCEQFRQKYKTKDFCIWMFSEADKKAIVDDVFGKFHDVFGFYPVSTGSYYLDSFTLNYIKSKYPSVECAVATCWEEGPKAYHTCNNSWFTFMDGGPWAPWIPSKAAVHAPAANVQEDSGVVAIPHLSRDLIACFDGNGSNFGTHPQNVLRGMIYRDGEYPYLYNLIDQYRYQAKFNDGLAYNMVFVGPGWMNKAGRWEAPYELLVKSYRDCMAYYKTLKDAGELTDMTMSEYAKLYREKKQYAQPEVSLWKDILYGSEKQHFWYVDPFMRTCLDFNQGGAMIDLRPYSARYERKVGIGTGNTTDASYPYLIQVNYRAGYFTHYAGEGTVKSLKVSYGGEEADLCLTRTKAHVTVSDDTKVEVTAEPVEVVLSGVKFVIGSVFTFERGSGAVKFERKLISSSDKTAEPTFFEYCTASYGTTEYALDMTGITLHTDGDLKCDLPYEYKCREVKSENGRLAYAVIPQINTRLEIACDTPVTMVLREGYAFSPVFTLAIEKRLKAGEVLTSWLSPKKAN